MRRKIWMVLLGVGAIAGFASGVHSLRHGNGCGCGPWRGQRHAAFERHVADVCVQAAERNFHEKTGNAVGQ